MITDVIIVALTVAVGVWGYSRGVSVGILIGFGFGIGALLGSRIGPLILDGGLRDPLAPAFALPGALLLGGALAAVLERFGFQLRRGLRRHYRTDAIGGALLAGFLGIVLVWVAGALGAQVDGVDGTVQDSEIISRLNSVLPPPGPVVSANEDYSLPRVSRAQSRPASDRLKHDPQVEVAKESVVKIAISGCGAKAYGSGWVGADGLVVTNAHVVHSFQRWRVQIEGGDGPFNGTPILFDVKNDIAILRVPKLKGTPHLRIGAIPKTNSAAVVLGFPFGKHYKARAARIGPTVPMPWFREATARTYKSLTTILRSGVGHGPGSSGGPILNLDGEVVAMIFAGPREDRGRTQFGVPSSSMKRDLRRAIASPQDVPTACHGFKRPLPGQGER